MGTICSILGAIAITVFGVALGSSVSEAQSKEAYEKSKRDNEAMYKKQLKDQEEANIKAARDQEKLNKQYMYEQKVAAKREARELELKNRRNIYG